MADSDRRSAGLRTHPVDPTARRAPDDAATLVAAYHASARAELIARIDKRDSSMFLYVGAVATLSAFFLDDYPSGSPALLVIPLLGLGAGMVHAQHNTVIGGLSVYVGDELYRAAVRETGTAGIRPWDSSLTYRELRGHIGTRFGSSVLILVMPSVVSIFLVLHAVPRTPALWALVLVAALATLWTLTLLVRAHRRRVRFTAQLAKTFDLEASGPTA